ncbi:MAG TPA: site-2 protease family protein [Terriglobales bacterium]|nr:site-2 protease family protein [Terriglobales bacterium]
MKSIRQGSMHLFRWAGVDVFLHWSWFLVAAYEISAGAGRYSSMGWNVGEYLALFAIVLMHEYGHALACRQVGGSADHIVLWPLGGVAYVDPPPRPAATLWSIAAGPLVNVVLLVVVTVFGMMGRSAGIWAANPNLHALMRALWVINVWLLVFNLLPIYPLDGGQILRSLLWFVLGRARSLMAATIIGFMGVVGLLVVAARIHSFWFAVISVFILMNCWGGLRHARALSRLAKLPHHEGFACPECQAPPPRGKFWKCAACGTAFDTFLNQATCPQCSARFPTTMCVQCRRQHPVEEWAIAAVAAPRL